MLSMKSLILDAPAKLNLHLRVLRKRPDGYHELCTLFHRISLCDTLQLTKTAEGIQILCSDSRVPKRDNILVRAFKLLKKERPFSGGVRIRLTKRIPVGGGLGGGSSNAAAFLRGVNRLYRLGLSRKRIVELGRTLGADVPFFLSGSRHALGTGRGDKIRPIAFRKRLGFILFPARNGLSTRQVYQNLRLERGGGSLTPLTRDAKLISAFLEKGKSREALRLLVNDLAPSAERLRPSLKERRRNVSALQLGTCQMSGSGPTLFLLFANAAQAAKAFREVRNKPLFGRAILCQSF
jgi:4-diphosphocytidyl-2-C-methyl-D-erythritol kinase